MGEVVNGGKAPCVQPLLFLENIERNGSPGSRKGNLKAPFEAIEGDQACRINPLWLFSRFSGASIMYNPDDNPKP